MVTMINTVPAVGLSFFCVGECAGNTQLGLLSKAKKDASYNIKIYE